MLPIRPGAAAYDAAVEIDGLPLPEPAGPLDRLLQPGLAGNRDSVAVESAYRRLTWAELEEESARLAAGYLSLGLEPGDRLASLMPNRVALVVHYLACFKAGLVATPLNYRYTAREIDHALSVSTAAALVAHGERAADIAASELAGSLPRGTVVFRDAPDEELAGAAQGAAALRAGGDPTSTAGPAGSTSSTTCWPPSRSPVDPSSTPTSPPSSSSPPAPPGRRRG